MSNRSDDTGNNKLDASSSSPPTGDDTIVLTRNSPWRRRLRLTASGTSGSTISRQVISLFIRGMIEHVELADGVPVVVGRADISAGFRPDVDLTRYGAQEHGVSREHVRLHLHNQHLYITDLGSANGTFMLGEPLTPNEPRILHNGDELLLGRLAVQVLFE